MATKQNKRIGNVLKELNSFKAKYRNNPIKYTANSFYQLVRFLFYAVTFITLLFALQNANNFFDWFNREFRTQEYWLATAESLAPETNVQIFISKLGEPVYKGELQGLTNYSFVNEYFYTQAITEEDGTVLLYSITLRKPGFNPRIPYLLDEEVEFYRLGTFSFKDFNPTSEGAVAIQYLPSFRRHIYSEVYYFGNPGNYLYYTLTHNDAGIPGGFTDPDGLKAISLEESYFYDDCERDFLPRPGNINKQVDLSPYSELREITPNTITISGRDGTVFCKYSELFKQLGKIIFGPDLDRVRLYDSFENINTEEIKQFIEDSSTETN